MEGLVFLGREILKKAGTRFSLLSEKECINSIFEAFGWTVEARKKMRPTSVSTRCP